MSIAFLSIVPGGEFSEGDQNLKEVKVSFPNKDYESSFFVEDIVSNSSGFELKLKVNKEGKAEVKVQANNIPPFISGPITTIIKESGLGIQDISLIPAGKSGSKKNSSDLGFTRRNTAKLNKKNIGNKTKIHPSFIDSETSFNDAFRKLQTDPSTSSNGDLNNAIASAKKVFQEQKLELSQGKQDAIEEEVKYIENQVNSTELSVEEAVQIIKAFAINTADAYKNTSKLIDQVSDLFQNASKLLDESPELFKLPKEAAKAKVMKAQMKTKYENEVTQAKAIKEKIPAITQQDQDSLIKDVEKLVFSVYSTDKSIHRVREENNDMSELGKAIKKEKENLKSNSGKDQKELEGLLNRIKEHQEKHGVGAPEYKSEERGQGWNPAKITTDELNLLIKTSPVDIMSLEIFGDRTKYLLKTLDQIEGYVGYKGLKRKFSELSSKEDFSHAKKLDALFDQMVKNKSPYEQLFAYYQKLSQKQDGAEQKRLDAEFQALIKKSNDYDSVKQSYRDLSGLIAKGRTDGERYFIKKGTIQETPETEEQVSSARKELIEQEALSKKLQEAEFKAFKFIIDSSLLHESPKSQLRRSTQLGLTNKLQEKSYILQHDSLSVLDQLGAIVNIRHSSYEQRSRATASRALGLTRKFTKRNIVNKTVQKDPVEANNTTKVVRSKSFKSNSLAQFDLVYEINQLRKSLGNNYSKDMSVPMMFRGEIDTRFYYAMDDALDNLEGYVQNDLSFNMGSMKAKVTKTLKDFDGIIKQRARTGEDAINDSKLIKEIKGIISEQYEKQGFVKLEGALDIDLLKRKEKAAKEQQFDNIEALKNKITSRFKASIISDLTSDTALNMALQNLADRLKNKSLPLMLSHELEHKLRRIKNDKKKSIIKSLLLKLPAGIYSKEKPYKDRFAFFHKEHLGPLDPEQENKNLVEQGPKSLVEQEQEAENLAKQTSYQGHEKFFTEVVNDPVIKFYMYLGELENLKSNKLEDFANEHEQLIIKSENETMQEAEVTLRRKILVRKITCEYEILLQKAIAEQISNPLDKFIQKSKVAKLTKGVDQLLKKLDLSNMVDGEGTLNPDLFDMNTDLGKEFMLLVSDGKFGEILFDAGLFEGGINDKSDMMIAPYVSELRKIRTYPEVQAEKKDRLDRQTWYCTNDIGKTLGKLTAALHVRLKDPPMQAFKVAIEQYSKQLEEEELILSKEVLDQNLTTIRDQMKIDLAVFLIDSLEEAFLKQKWKGQGMLQRQLKDLKNTFNQFKIEAEANKEADYSLRLDKEFQEKITNNEMIKILILLKGLKNKEEYLKTLFKEVLTAEDDALAKYKDMLSCDWILEEQSEMIVDKESRENFIQDINDIKQRINNGTILKTVEKVTKNGTTTEVTVDTTLLIELEKVFVKYKKQGLDKKIIGDYLLSDYKEIRLRSINDSKEFGQREVVEMKLTEEQLKQQKSLLATHSDETVKEKGAVAAERFKKLGEELKKKESSNKSSPPKETKKPRLFFQKTRQEEDDSTAKSEVSVLPLDSNEDKNPLVVKVNEAYQEKSKRLEEAISKLPGDAQKKLEEELKSIRNDVLSYTYSLLIQQIRREGSDITEANIDEKLTQISGFIEESIVSVESKTILGTIPQATTDSSSKAVSEPLDKNEENNPLIAQVNDAYADVAKQLDNAISMLDQSVLERLKSSLDQIRGEIEQAYKILIRDIKEGSVLEQGLEDRLDICKNHAESKIKEIKLQAS